MVHSTIRWSGSALVRILTAIAMVLALGVAMIGTAAAAYPDGGSVSQTIPLTPSTVTGTLAPGQTIWFSYYHDANFNDAITLKSDPGIALTKTSADDYGSGVYFNVEWLGVSTDASFPGGQFAKDLPGYYRVGQSTRSALKDGTALPAGVQYWQQTKSTSSMPFVIAVVNNSAVTTPFALTINQSNNAVSADDNAMPAPWPTIVTAPTTNVVTAAPVPQAAPVGGTSPAQAIALSGTMRGSLAPGQSIWYSYYHDANTNDAITLKSNPAITMAPAPVAGYTSGVYFNVEWAGLSTDSNFPGGQLAKDAAGLWRIGQSTQSAQKTGAALPAGVQYWQQGTSTNSMTLFIDVVNQSSSTISYALTIDHSLTAVSADDNAMPAPWP